MRAWMTARGVRGAAIAARTGDLNRVDRSAGDRRFARPLSQLGRARVPGFFAWRELRRSAFPQGFVEGADQRIEEEGDHRASGREGEACGVPPSINDDGSGVVAVASEADHIEPGDGAAVLADGAGAHGCLLDGRFHGGRAGRRVARQVEGCGACHVRAGHGRARHGGHAGIEVGGQDRNTWRPGVHTTTVVAERGLLVAAVGGSPMYFW